MTNPQDWDPIPKNPIKINNPPLELPYREVKSTQTFRDLHPDLPKNLTSYKRYDGNENIVEEWRPLAGVLTDYSDLAIKEQTVQRTIIKLQKELDKIMED